MSEWKESLTRRSVLRAAGLTIGLPGLASLQDMPFLQSACQAEESSIQKSPKRFCCIFFPNGVSLPPKDHEAFESGWHWFPQKTGVDYQLTQPLLPLSKYRKSFSILSGLSHPAMRSTIAHVTADTFLTGADSSDVYSNSISLDQVLAREFGNQTRFSSLSLSSDGGVGAPGRTKTLSFTASGYPIPSLASPRAIYNRLFGISNRSLEEQRRSFGRDRSILDNVLSETSAIQRQLSAADRKRLDEYTNSVREVERRLARADQWLDTASPQVDASDLDLNSKPTGDAQDYIRAIFDLMVLALLTDSTRAITYQITSEDAKGIGDRFPASIGLQGHHSLSHDYGKDNGYQNWSRYDQFLCSQLAYFLGKLSNTKDPFQDGSLLDNTIVYYGGSTSRTHLAMNYPLIVAGGQKMGFQHGRHHRFDESRERLANLYVTFLQRLGVETDRFADSTGSLQQGLVS